MKYIKFLDLELQTDHPIESRKSYMALISMK